MPPLGPFVFESNYVATVLKNEWPQSGTYLQALYAGAVVIRTFGQRPADGCGAIAYTHADGRPVENNISQRYLPNTNVQAFHRTAANRTAGITILRLNDNGVACAKHFADTGDPTGSFGDEGSPTDTAVQDDVNISYAQHNPGISQNGSAAWSIGAGSARLNWPQMLGKYYTRISLSGGTNNTGIPIPQDNFRWTWTDVTATTDYTGTNGQRYHSPKFNTATTIRPNCIYGFPFTIFNGSKMIFYANWGSPANPTRLSYHWYRVEDGALVVFDGFRSWGTDIGWGQQQTITAWVKAPSAAGNYRLTWDLVQENVAWFKDRGATRQEIVVSVTGTPCP
ncbi:MAG TPA: hypothetical protein VJG32_13570 [Anaerolineae bacterium]|nr:hypothetical protein [Anaerolineae bacterium]